MLSVINRLAFILVANFALLDAVVSLHRHVEFHCELPQNVLPSSRAVQQATNRSFFDVLFKALIDGQSPQSIHSTAMALLPKLPMANASSGIAARLAPEGDHASEDAEMHEILRNLDGIDLASNITAEINASSNPEIKFPETSQSSMKLDAEAARVNASSEKMRCIFESMLSDHCGHLKSRDATRRGSWESVCLDYKHAHDSTDAYELMSAEERKYSRKIRHMTTVGRHTVELWNDNAQYKAILCIQMKIVDDGCLSFKEPRFSPQARSVKNLRVVKGFVESSKTQSQTKPLKKKVEIGTMSAHKDDAAKLVNEELEAVHQINQ